jgi:two-component system cell cycle response regulator CtrA
MTTLRDDYVAALEAENEDLRARIVRLEESMGARIEAPLEFRFTGQETKVFGILLKRELVTKVQALDALYGHLPEQDEAEIKIVDVFICRMRKKLEPFDIKIETVWGQGYRMPAASKATAQAMLDQSRAS